MVYYIILAEIFEADPMYLYGIAKNSNGDNIILFTKNQNKAVTYMTKKEANDTTTLLWDKFHVGFYVDDEEMPRYNIASINIAKTNSKNVEKIYSKRTIYGRDW